VLFWQQRRDPIEGDFAILQMSGSVFRKVQLFLEKHSPFVSSLHLAAHWTRK